MKKLTRLFTVTALALTAFCISYSCNSPEEIDPTTGEPGGDVPATVLEITGFSGETADVLTFGKDGETRTVYVSTNGTLSVNTTADWISIKIWEGDYGMFDVTVTANPDTSPRTADIELSATGEDNKTVTATLPVRQEETVVQPQLAGASYTLAGDVWYADDKRAGYVTAFDPAGRTITMNKPSDGTLPVPGQVAMIPHVSSTLPEGFLGRINSVALEQSDAITYTYDEIPLNEAFRSFDFKEVELDLGEHVKEIRDDKGRPVQFVKTRATASGTVPIHIPQFELSFGSTTIKPSADMTIGMKFSMNGGFNGLDYFGGIVDADVTLNLGLECAGQFDLLKNSYPVLTVLCGAFPLGPVVVTPIIEIRFVVGADGKITIQAGLKYSNGFKMKSFYQAGAGCESSFELKEVPDTDEMFTLEKFGEFVSDAGGSLEAGIYMGLETNVGLGVYGTVLYGTIGLREKVRCYANIPWKMSDLAQWVGGGESGLGTLPWESTFIGVDDLMQGVMSLKSLGIDITDPLETNDHVTPLYKRYLIPYGRTALREDVGLSGSVKLAAMFQNDLIAAVPVGVNIYCFPIGGQSWIKEATIPLGYYLDVDEEDSAHFYTDYDSQWDDKDYYRIEFEYSPRDDNTSYCVIPYYEIGGFKIECHPGDYMHEDNATFKSSSRDAAGLREILMDILPHIKSLGGAQKPQNWGSALALVYWEGVYVTVSDGITRMEIEIDPKKWVIDSDFTIGKHTGKDIEWRLGAEISDNVRSITINDPNGAWFPHMSDALRSLEVHSDKFNPKGAQTGEGFVWKGAELETLILDIPGWTSQLTLKTPKLKKLEFSRMTNLNKLEIGESEGFRELSISDSPLETLIFRKGDLSQFNTFKDLPEIKSLHFYDIRKFAALVRFEGLTNLHRFYSGDLAAPMQEAVFTGCGDMHMLMLPPALNITVQNCGYGSVNDNPFYDAENNIVRRGRITIDSCDKLMEITYGEHDSIFYGYDPTYVLADAFAISNCKALKTVMLKGAQLSSLSISSCPAISDADFRDNHLTGLVPAFIDEIRERNQCGYLFYDHKYWYGGGYETNQYGYYYPGEPERGYHSDPQSLNN